MVMLDFNSDGRIDFGCVTSVVNNNLVLYRNDGNLQFTVVYKHSTTLSPGGDPFYSQIQPNVADMNGDGIDDVVLAQSGSSPAYFLTFETWPVPGEFCFHVNAVAFYAGHGGGEKLKICLPADRGRSAWRHRVRWQDGNGGARLGRMLRWSRCGPCRPSCRAER